MRAVEFAILFFGVPALFAFARHRLPALPALWLFAGFCLIVLLRDPSLDRRQLWNAAALPGHLTGILLPFGAVAVFLMLAVWRFAPALFLFHRYGGLFGGGLGVVMASAVAFGFLHVVLRNGWAVGLSALAGLLFAARYWQTGSLFVSAFEHALYGGLIFTSGLGRFFYSGAVRRFWYM